MADFAQTREADNLFDSEISAPPPPPPSAPTEPRAFSTRGGRVPRRQSRGGEKSVSPKTNLVVSGAPEDPTAVSAVKPLLRNRAVDQQVQQDRTLSGGLKKPKLTEEEMTARLEHQKLLNQLLVDRRRKVEEDENSFQVQEEARKQADASKRFVERKKKVEQERSRKELDDEREKNRQRKLNAVRSREWDSTKTEEDYNPKGQSSRFRRGAYGAVTGPPTAPRGAPRGAPTGPRRNATASVGTPSKNPTSTQEWPGLPPAAKDKLPTKDELSAGGEALIGANGQLAAGDEPTDENEPRAEDKASGERRPDADDGVGETLAPLSPVVGGDSWAEQVEAGA